MLMSISKARKRRKREAMIWRGYRSTVASATRRSEVLANNLANVDTPHCKARDFDFRSALTSAMHKSDLPLT